MLTNMFNIIILNNVILKESQEKKTHKDINYYQEPGAREPRSKHRFRPFFNFVHDF